MADNSKHRTYARLRHRDLREQLLAAYGNCCACCGETRNAFLSLDHIANDGAEERRRLNGSNSGCSTSGWLDLKRRGWPKDNYRLLCYNCNVGRHRNWRNPGICPHEIERGEIISKSLNSDIVIKGDDQLEFPK